MRKLRRTAGGTVVAAVVLYVLNAYFQAGAILGNIAAGVFMIAIIVWFACVAFDRVMGRSR